MRLLYFIQLPPPVHGASKINEFVYKSSIINKGINKRLITVNYNSRLSSINHFNLYKIVIYFNLYFKFLYELLCHRPKLVYYTIPPTGIGFYKDFPFIFLMKILFIKPLYHLHGKGIYEHAKNSKFKTFLHRWAYSNSNIIHLSENLIQREIAFLNLKKSDLFVVNNGVARLNSKIKLEPKGDSINLLFLSNLFVSKGILFAFDMLSNLLKTHKKIHLHVIGRYPNEDIKKLIEAKVINNGLQNFVTIYGPLYGKDKLQIMSKTDALIYPSFNDAYPLVILEALQIGIPVVASDQGAIPEIINEKIGYVFKTGNIEEATTMSSIMIKKLLKNPEHYRKDCLDVYNDKYNLGKFEKKMRMVYNQILCVE